MFCSHRNRNLNPCRAFLGMKRRLAELEESLKASSTEQACTQNLGAGNLTTLELATGGC